MSELKRLEPLLVVREAARAVDFYVRALGVREVARFTHPATGALSHADLAFGDVAFSVTEEARAWNSDAPPSLGGSPVVLQLETDDVDALFARLVDAGATVVFPLQEFAGVRMGRVRDPFGHLWLISQRLEALTPDEIQRRRDAFAAEAAKTGRT